MLLGFQFGNNFTEHEHAAIINLQLQPLDPERVIETWWYKGEIKYTKSGPVRVAECQDYTAVILRKDPVAPEDFREQTRQAYTELINAVRSTSHSTLVRIWNYFDDINAGNDDLEKYRQFCVGRAEAFETMGIHDDIAPVGTAIGGREGSGFALIGLASKQAFHPVENPRQTSAFNYPRQYGPRSPKFCRGGFIALDSHTLFLVSGTAAVVGHESNFPFNTGLQADETLNNLAILCDEISRLEPGKAQFVLDDQSILRVYLKNPDDYRVVLEKMNRLMKGFHQKVIFLQGTICRQELMVEVEGAKVV